MTEKERLDLQLTLYRSKNPTRRWLHQTRRAWIEQQLASGGPCRRALEVGPGSGIYLPALARAATSVVAADIEDAFLKHAKQLSQSIENLACVRDDITHTELEPDQFDLILCTEVIEHIADSRAALRGLFRLLAPGGRLILTTPQRFSLLEQTCKLAFLPGVIQAVRLIYGEPVHPTEHINLLTVAELREQFEETGFVALDSHKSGLYVPVVAESLGNVALALEQWCEPRLRHSPLAWMLWTQYWVLTKPLAAQESTE